jgi:hypothetical protein
MLRSSDGNLTMRSFIYSLITYVAYFRLLYFPCRPRRMDPIQMVSCVQIDSNPPAGAFIHHDPFLILGVAFLEKHN